MDDFSHLLCGIHPTVFKPQFDDGIDTISLKEQRIVSSTLACTQLEIYEETTGLDFISVALGQVLARGAHPHRI